MRERVLRALLMLRRRLRGARDYHGVALRRDASKTFDVFARYARVMRAIFTARLLNVHAAGALLSRAQRCDPGGAALS